MDNYIPPRKDTSIHCKSALRCRLIRSLQMDNTCMALSRMTCRFITVVLLVLSVLSTTLFRGCWTIAQCVHDETPPRYVLVLGDEPHVFHHQHVHSQMDGASHSMLHMMDSIEHSLPPLLSDNPIHPYRYPSLLANRPYIPDYERARLFRPPRPSFFSHLS